jgi:hypothetical protein
LDIFETGVVLGRVDDGRCAEVPAGEGTVGGKTGVVLGQVDDGRCAEVPAGEGTVGGGAIRRSWIDGTHPGRGCGASRPSATSDCNKAW